MAASGLYIWLMKPAMPEIKKYKIGEQGLFEEQANRKEKLGQIVVASIGDYELTAGEVELALGKLPPFQRYYYSSPERIVIFIQNYILTHLLAVEGKTEGLSSDPYVRFVLEEELARRYKQVFLAEAAKASDVTEFEVAAFVEVHGDELRERMAVGEEDTEDAVLATAGKAAILEQRRNQAWLEHVRGLSGAVQKR